MFCARCGKEILKDSKFCTSCENLIETNKMGKITFHRMRRIMGCAIPISVTIDGNKAGTIANNGTLVVNIPIGTHQVVFDLWSGISQTEIEVSEECPNVFVDIKLKMGALTNSIEVVNIRNER